MSKKEKDNKHESAELQPQRQEITPIETRELEVSPEAAEVLRELPEKKRDVIISEIIRYEQQSFLAQYLIPTILQDMKRLYLVPQTAFSLWQKRNKSIAMRWKKICLRLNANNILVDKTSAVDSP